MAHYVLTRDGINEGVILWDGETPFDLGPGVELVEESKYAGPRPPEIKPEPTPDDRIATLEEAMSAIAKAPDFARAKLDVAAVKDARAAAGEVEAIDVAKGRNP